MPAADGKPVYEIGLVMAGAISAGAYTAGVVDFLIEALDAWAAAPEKDGGPAHRLRLKVMTGASAGAMTAAIAAIGLQAETEPVGDVQRPPPPRRNRLFDAWVRQIDIAPLLGDRDLRADKRLRSALDSTVLGEIAASALDVDIRAAPRPYVADPLPVFLTVANLRGVPYGFRLLGEGSTVYGMLSHGDHLRFAVSRTGATAPGALLLDPATAPGGDWPRLAEAALASGAFPLGLQARRLNRPHADHNGRFGRDPVWMQPVDPYSFLCVDGGLMDNEPLELARHYLADGGRNPRDGRQSKRAVIMIDPFPNRVRFDPEDKLQDGLLPVLGGMFTALVNQARFKPEELALAEDDDNYSRFMISPSRRAADGSKAELAIASATLDGFGGFLSETFRTHDFVLGRRNCQNFLRRHFCLPEDNPLFAGWTDPASRETHYARGGDGKPVLYDDDGQQKMLPIVPLMPEVRGEIEPCDWPRPEDVDLGRLGALAEARIKRAAGALLDGELRGMLGGTTRWVVRRYIDWKLGATAAEKVRAAVAADLDRMRG